MALFHVFLAVGIERECDRHLTHGADGILDIRVICDRSGRSGLSNLSSRFCRHQLINALRIQSNLELITANL
ncbi:hypothetical protein QUB68_02745 [Microcoleus sp. A006_D1]|uniref:hypothetical protein n=1 Tax=Microcoleus sp. A006_D1 TaxID=3055267 RepID=UPI002FD416D4